MLSNVKQTDITDCGIACIKSILSNFGVKVDLYKLKLLHPLKIGYYSFLDLANITNKYGIEAEGYLLDFESLKKIDRPIIAHTTIMGLFPHFVVISKIEGKNVFCMDPAKGKIVKMNERKFNKRWSNKILFFSKQAFQDANLKVTVQDFPVFQDLPTIKVLLINKRTTIACVLTFLVMQILLYFIIAAQ
jgi:ATP-binding cassette, subfamily C, bacteriocin exporter